MLHLVDMKTPKYLPRGRFCGNIEWLCAYCGKINKNRLYYGDWKIECVGKNCSKRFTIGLSFYAHTRQSSGGRGPWPPHDYSLPELVEYCDSFPIALVENWQPGSNLYTGSSMRKQAPDWTALAPSPRPAASEPRMHFSIDCVFLVQK
jgi:hypothetical protein